MKFILFSFLIIQIIGAEDFITKEEYAKMLYHNPRGVGCHKCHGEDGRGLELGRYRDGNKTVILKAPNIKNLSYSRFKRALQSSHHKLMPQYFLTKKEITMLYYYLKKLGRKRAE